MPGTLQGRSSNVVASKAELTNEAWIALALKMTEPGGFIEVHQPHCAVTPCNCAVEVHGKPLTR